MMNNSFLKMFLIVSLAVLTAAGPFPVFAEEEPSGQTGADTPETEEVMPEDTETEEVFAEEEAAEEEPETEAPEEEIPAEEETESAEDISDPVISVNDVYEGIIAEEDLSFTAAPAGRKLRKALSAQQTTVYTDAASAADRLREDIKARSQGMELSVEIPLQYEDVSEFDVSGFANKAFNRMVGEIMDAVMVYTDAANEGDYIKYQYGGYKFTPKKDDEGKTMLSARKNKSTGIVTIVGTMTVSFSYYTDAAQEAETASLIREILDEMDIESHTETEKIRRIYRYICDNVSYDYEHVNDSSYTLQYTAYAAVHDHTAVCQGYAALFYRMAKEAGLDARILSGTGSSEKHAWNLVKLKDRYYLLDCTWDAGRQESSCMWFLKCPSSFRNHTTGSDAYNQRVLNDSVLADSDYVRLQGISVSETKVILKDKNEETGFSVIYIPENATVKDLITESTDPSAAVFADGRLQIRNYGETKISFLSEDGYYEAEVNVRTGDKARLTVSGGTGSGLYYPETEVSVTADEAAPGERFARWDTELTPAPGYSLTDEAAVLLMGKSDTVVQAAYEDIPAEMITVSPAETELKLGTEMIITAEISPAEAVKVYPVWSSSDPSVVSAGEDGTIRAADFGTAVITASASDGSVSAEATITVYSDPCWIQGEKGLKWREKYGSTAALKWVKTDGSWYYFRADGYLYKGWLKYGGNWYWLESDGRMASGVRKISGKYYFFLPDGAMVTGWQKADGYWYYFNENGEAAVGWKYVNGRWYYFSAEGIMLTGWQKVNGVWYYLHASGAMAKGWEKIDGRWYFLDRSSGAMRTGWLKDGKTWYYLSSSGAMVTGWQKAGGVWYFFDASGAMLTERWIGDYYVTSSGVMAVNTWIGNIHVDSSGKRDAVR